MRSKKGAGARPKIQKANTIATDMGIEDLEPRNDSRPEEKVS